MAQKEKTTEEIYEFLGTPFATKEEIEKEFNYWNKPVKNPEVPKNHKNNFNFAKSLILILLLSFNIVDAQEIKFVIPFRVKTECKVDKAKIVEFDCIKTLFPTNSHIVLIVNEYLTAMTIKIPTEGTKTYVIYDVQIVDEYASFSVHDNNNLSYVINYYFAGYEIVIASYDEYRESKSYIKITKYFY